MIKWNEYTWYSKLAVIILFIGIIPTLTFYIGTQYEATKDVLNVITPLKIIPIAYQTPSQHFFYEFDIINYEKLFRQNI
jgi:hypothetical protein